MRGLSLTLVLAGVLLWGVAQGVHDAVMLAALSHFVPEHLRARAFGLFSALYGIAWFAGSAVLGWLYDHNLPALAVVSGTVCMDKYEASVWRVPDPAGANKGLVKRIQTGRSARSF